MIGKLSLLLVCVAVASGNPAAGKPFHWKPRTPTVAPVRHAAPGRVVGGSEATPHSWPHQVALYIDFMYFCGGSLISNEWVLTAAHCVDGAMFAEVVMGAHNLDEDEASQVSMTSTDITVHEGFNLDMIDNDIALIKLPMAVEFNEYIDKVALPSTDTSVGASVTATGWGRVADDAGGISSVLNQVTRPVISNEECTVTYGDIIDDGIICIDSTGGEGVCNGDSGGPLNKDGFTYGIASFVSDDGCESGHPHAFTRVHYYLDWIEGVSGVTP